MRLIHLWDGLNSLVAAVATVLLCGAPSWFSHLAIDAGLVPFWGYAPVAALAVVGLILTVAFLRKAAGGVSPGRDRRRR